MLKKIVSIFIVAHLLLPSAGFSSETTGFKARLGCVPFMATTLQAMAFTEDISSSLLNSIDRSRFFEIVERKKIEQYLELEGFRLDNLDHESILKISSKAGLDYVVHGSVSVNDASTVLDITLVNVRARKVLLKESFSLSQADFSRKLLEIAHGLIEKVKTGSSQPAKTAAAAGLPVKPPEKLETVGAAGSIRLRWHSDMRQIAGFNIYRSVSGGGSYTLHGSTTETFFSDENLKLNEVFYYRVAAVSNSGVISELSPPVRGGTAVAPPSPIFMNIEPDIKGSRLTWRPRPAIGGDSKSETKGYRIYRKQMDESAFAPVATVPADAAAFADNGLKEGVQYLYAITAHNSSGIESEFSSRLSILPLPLPNPVRGVGGRIRHVPLSWDRYPAEQAEGYVLFRSAKKEGSYSAIARMDNLATTTYADRDLQDNTTYWYRLSVYKKGGIETAPSEPVSFTTRDLPPAPLNLSASSGMPRMVALKWQITGEPEDEIKSVVIYRVIDDMGLNLEKIEEITAEKSEFVDNKPPLKDKTAYRYRVSARNSGGAVSLQSAVASATTKAPPEIPANLAGTSGGVKKTELTWTKNRENDIKEYQIYLKRPGDADFKEIKSVSENRYLHTDLNDNAEYVYKIRAVDRDDLVSAFSEPVKIRTKPLPGKVAGFDAVDTANRTVAWKPNQEKDVRSYNIYKKGFLGISQKVATVQGTQWQADEPKGSLELYVTAVDESGLESEPSESVIFKER